MYRSSFSWIALAMAVLGLCISTAIDLAQAQAPTQPTAKPPQRRESPGYSTPAPGNRSTTNVGVYGGYPGSSGGGTVAGNALNGMGSVISAKGDYNLSTSEAAINMTLAQKNDIQNRQLYSDTYFEMRAANRAATAAERGPRPTEEQLVRIAHQGVPRPLSTSQMDPVSGRLEWPDPLQAKAFEAQRSEVDQLFAKRANYGGLGYSDQAKLREAVNAMSDQLKEQIREIPPQEYVASRSFLKSMQYVGSKTSLE
jgi:hypothetical protein